MPENSALDYLERIAEYYQVLGYGEPYQWVHFDEVPFTALTKSLSECRIGIITTAARYKPDAGGQGAGSAYNGLAKFYSVYADSIDPEPELYISHVAYDRVHTSATDQRSYFPLSALKQLQKAGRLNLSPRYYGLPTNRSQATTIEVDCPELVRLCQQDKLDAAILVPNCPVCHQSVSLAANALEAVGIASVIMGCAKDIVEYVGVPRFLFNNFPLGNSAGLPDDPDSQLAIAEMALDLLMSAKEPRTTRQSSFAWSGKANWQLDYSNARILSAEEIEKRRAEFDRGKRQAKSVR